MEGGDAVSALWAALSFRAGFNATLVALGSAMLGAAAGAVGSFLVLRRQALMSDALAHATLPGVALAFLVMVALGGEGRNLPGLMAGAAVTAALGLIVVEWLTRRTRLAEDAAIGAVLSVFFGAGVVLLTVIQTLPGGRQAGLEGFLLGSTAGMLQADALVIASGGALAGGAVWALRRPLAILAFDPGHARAMGLNPRWLDLALMALVLGVVVVGLRIVGLVLIVALLIIPPVAARFWTDRAGVMAAIAAAIGALAGYGGAALSAAGPDLPTGPLIVLVAAGLFGVSLLAAPGRGVLAAALRHRRFQARLHRRQGLLALARGEPVHDPLSFRLLRRDGVIRPDGIPTTEGRAAIAAAARDEARWAMARRLHRIAPLAGGARGRANLHRDGLTPIDAAFTPDQIAALDAALGPPRPADEETAR